MGSMRSTPYIQIYNRSDDVTGSCSLVTSYLSNNRTIRFLVDCGAFQGQRDNQSLLNESVPFNTEKIDFVLITHTHLDHVGLLPLLVKQGYTKNIFMSFPTYNLIDIPLRDAYKINSKSIDTAIYDQEDLYKTFSLMVGVPFNKILKPVKGISVIFKQNGHLVGASSIEVTIHDPIGEDIKLLFTGDYKEKNVFFDIEKVQSEEDTSSPYSAIICESTYGDVDSTDSMFYPCILENINKALWNGKNVISPTFGIGKTQEVLYLLKCGQEKNLFPKNTNFYLVGGIAQEATKRFQYTDLGIKLEMKDFIPQNFHLLKGHQTSQDIIKLFDDSSPNVIIGPSGMADAGGIRKFVQNAISRDDILVQLTGYCDPSSIATKLLNTPIEGNMLIDGKTITKRCQVEISKEISLHAKRDELKKMLEGKNTNSILITHGETKVREKFREYLLLNNICSQIEILNSDFVFEINSNGIRDVFPSNF